MFGRCLFFFEPTDRRKAIKPFDGVRQIAYSSPNVAELRAIAGFINPNYVVNTSTQLQEVIELSQIVSEHISFLIVTLGSKGVITTRRVNENGREFLNVRLYHVAALNLDIENVSGAGDCFSSGFIHGMMLGLEESHCISMGFDAARQALLCKLTVPLQFNFKSIIKEANFETWRYDIKFSTHE